MTDPTTRRIPAMVFAAFDTFGFRVLLLGHLLCAFVAFAPAMVWPVMNRLRRTAAAGAGQGSTGGEFEGLLSPAVHGGTLVASGLFGIAMIPASDELFAFDQMWISTAFLLWFLMLGVVFGLLAPAQRARSAGEVDAEKRIAMAYGGLHLLLLLQIIVMIWKPGL